MRTRLALTALLASAALMGCGGGDGDDLPDALTIMATWETSSTAPGRCIEPESFTILLDDLTSESPVVGGDRACGGTVEEGEANWILECPPTVVEGQPINSRMRFEIDKDLMGGVIVVHQVDGSCNATFRITSIVER
jgi:hypothetical protein